MFADQLVSYFAFTFLSSIIASACENWSISSLIDSIRIIDFGCLVDDCLIGEDLTDESADDDGVDTPEPDAVVVVDD